MVVHAAAAADCLAQLTIVNLLKSDLGILREALLCLAA